MDNKITSSVSYVQVISYCFLNTTGKLIVAVHKIGRFLVVSDMNGSFLTSQRTQYLSILLLIKRYNLCNVLACSTTFFQLSLFCAILF